MPRKPRCRCIGGYPDHWAFSPDEAAEGEPIVMGLDEFETIRLLDTAEGAAFRFTLEYAPDGKNLTETEKNA